MTVPGEISMAFDKRVVFDNLNLFMKSLIACLVTGGILLGGRWYKGRRDSRRRA
jgi:hypothetical protein